MAALSTVSIRPSTLTGARSGYPEWVLLDKKARFSGDRNATTAACRALEDQPVAVSFWLTGPPEVSHFSVHCPGVDEEDLKSDPPPFIISAEGAFVLFCVTLDGSDHHFVYSARGIPDGKKKKKHKPSLHLLPEPSPAVEAFVCQQFGILPVGDEHYAVAFLDHQWDNNAWVYRAHVFSSETKAWRTSAEALLHLPGPDHQALFDRHASSKQIAVGASSLGWVDLLRGILLLGNLFDDRPVITYIPLPAGKACITDEHGDPHYAPEYFRDVVACSCDDDDLIKFVEVEFEDPDCRTSGKAWKATTWSRRVSWDDDWRKRRTVDSAQISVDPSYYDSAQISVDPSYYDSALLPGLLDGKKQKPELKDLCFLNPTLSVHDDDLLYMLAKVDDTAWVVALDMKHASLQALVPVSTRESRAITMYYSCAFPKYYTNNSTSDTGSPVEKDKLQQGRPDSDDSGGNLQKKRRKKKKTKQARLAGRRVEQPFLLYFLGCLLIAIIVKVFCHLF